MTLIIGLAIGLLIGIIIMFLFARIMISSMQSSLERQFSSRIESFAKSQESAHLTALLYKEKEFIEKEKAIRNDSAKKSRSVRLGSIAEKMLPVSGKIDYDPEDMAFLGRPVDYIVFDGMREGKISDIVFLEIKTGSSVLSDREKQIMDCVENNKIVFKTIRL
jgi:predicted Holliday junction resolvase-like endonuclease